MYHHTNKQISNSNRIAVHMAVLLLSAGCGSPQEGGSAGSDPPGEPAPPTVTKSVIDREMFQAAVDEQRSFEAAGTTLKTRAWLRADAYIATYQTSNGAFLATQRVGKDSLLAGVDLPNVTHPDRVNEFLKSSDVATPTRVTDLATDQLWFKPEVDSVDLPAGIGQTKQASTLQDVANALTACNNQARSGLNSTPGYVGAGTSADPVFDWAWTFGDNDEVQDGHGGAYLGVSDIGEATGDTAYAAVCGRAVQGSLTFVLSNAVQGTKLTPTRATLTVQPLAFVGILLADGWTDVHCGFLVPGCSYRIDFNDTFFAFQAAPGNNLETFVGQVTHNQSMYFSNGCNLLFGSNCPSFSSSVPFTVSGIYN